MSEFDQAEFSMFVLVLLLRDFEVVRRCNESTVS